jgi:hypothetical protein
VEGREPSLDLLGEDGPVNARRAAAAAVAMLVLVSCTSSPSDKSGAPSSSPSSTSSAPDAQERRTTEEVEPPTPPQEGECHRLTFGQLTRASDDSPPVPCTGTHNAVTIHVGELDTIVDGRSTAADSEKVLNQVSTTCPRRHRSYVGGNRSTRALSRFHVVWFTPTLDQFDAGATWFRCDLVAFAGHDSLAPLPRPGRLAGVLDDADALDDYGLCGTADPGAAGFERVICSRRHSWRATSIIRLDGGAKYPGARAVRNAGDETCRDRVRRISKSSLRFRYGWEWPTRDQWRRGQRYGYCWAPR